MSGRRHRLRLSYRIMIAFGLGGLFVSVAVALSAYLFAYRFLVHQQEHDAMRQSYLGAAIVRDQLRAGTADVPGILDALTPGATSTAAEAVVYSDGRWYSSSLLVSRDTLPTSLRRTVVGGSPALMWTRINSTPQLAVAVPIPAVRAAYFDVIDESALSRTLATLRSILFGAASATTVAGGALGLWASRRLTRPLRAVTQASAEIGAGRLDTHLTEDNDPDLAGLVVNFNTMVDSLRERIERDARFAADVSHELRSPLTTLRTAFAVLEGRSSELSERGRNALTLVASELARFDRLVRDLLEISRLDAGEPVVEQERLRISELVLNLLERPDYRGIPADIDAGALDAVVTGDKRRLEQVFRNLLDNAQIHAGGATGVVITTTDEHVMVTVSDAGPGVEPVDRHRIFERFARAGHSGRRGSGGGSGLGLALVTEHVRAHDGTVRVAAVPSGGAAFTVELPLVGR